MIILTWIAILLCLSQSALLSGLNLAMFSMSKLELEVETKKGNLRASKVLKFRKDSNFTLVTILWGNVSVNVLLALLADSILLGITAFLFSTIVITIFAEIIPQAYFSRNALKVAAKLCPVLKFYQVLLFPVAKPTALVLNQWLGFEDVRFYTEKDLRRVIQLHMDATESDIARMEGQGAINFLDIDDVNLTDEGEPIASSSIIEIGFENDIPLFPNISPIPDDPFLKKLYQADRKWAVLVDSEREPRLILNTSDFVAEILMSDNNSTPPTAYCHKPIVVRDGNLKLGEHLTRFNVCVGKVGTEVIDNDVILLWNDSPRIISGTDILGRLFRGIGKRVSSGTPETHRNAQQDAPPDTATRRG